MITGEDLVIVTASDPLPMVRGFLQQWSQRWPAMRVAVGEGAEFESWPQASSQLTAATGEVLVARDRQMDLEWDDQGYYLTSEGEGPFAIMYRPYPRRFTRMVALEDPYDRGDDFQYEPYEVSLMAHGLSLVTVVTAEMEHDFTTAVVDGLTRQPTG